MERGPAGDSGVVARLESVHGKRIRTEETMRVNMAIRQDVPSGAEFLGWETVFEIFQTLLRSD
jgi:hypothetical protein